MHQKSNLFMCVCVHAHTHIFRCSFNSSQHLDIQRYSAPFCIYRGMVGFGIRLVECSTSWEINKKKSKQSWWYSSMLFWQTLSPSSCLFQVKNVYVKCLITLTLLEDFRFSFPISMANSNTARSGCFTQPVGHCCKCFSK